MKIALIGASGNVGTRILAELVARGHQVTGIGRNPDRIPNGPHVTAEAGDIADRQKLSRLLAGHDAVISSARFKDIDPSSLIDTVRASGVKRYLVVGGAASLEVAPGQMLFDAPNFPAAYKAEASVGIAFLDALRGVTDLDWTFLSPSAMFVPGERTGKFRLGSDQLLSTENGSSISYEDYAIAMVDELEIPKHRNARFTVGY
jgi:putative NADH-flavin reductase